jgi:hypothetical protein
MLIQCLVKSTSTSAGRQKLALGTADLSRTPRPTLPSANGRSAVAAHGPRDKNPTTNGTQHSRDEAQQTRDWIL